MEAGGHTDNTDADGTDNVIRFPRDWFGSTDDLVPFGPAADRLAAAAAERERRREDDLADALTANDFWGEGAGALHQPVGVPEVEEPCAPESATPPLGRFETDPSRPRLAAVEPVDAWRRSSPRLPSRGWLSGVAVAVMLTCAVGIFLLGRSHAAPTAARTAAVDHPSFSPPPSENLSQQVDLLAMRGVREAARAVAVVERLPVRAPRRRGTAKPRRRARHAGATHAGATRHTGVATASPGTAQSVSVAPLTSVADSSVAATAASSSSAAAESSVTRVSAVKPSSTRTGASSGASASPVSRSTKSTASQSSKSAASRSSKSSSASSTLAPGPTTAGSAGSNCDPQCQ